MLYLWYWNFATSVLDSNAKRTLHHESKDFNSDHCQSNEPEISGSETTSEEEENFHTENASSLFINNSYDIPRQTIDISTLKVKRLRANDRERRRVNLINSAMEMLRKVIPEVRERRKITKLELLRSANKYIWILQQSLLTGRTIPEIQKALAFYQYNGLTSTPYSYEYAVGYAVQSPPPQ